MLSVGGKLAEESSGKKYIHPHLTNTVYHIWEILQMLQILDHHNQCWVLEENLQMVFSFNQTITKVGLLVKGKRSKYISFHCYKTHIICFQHMPLLKLPKETFHPFPLYSYLNIYQQPAINTFVYIQIQ